MREKRKGKGIVCRETLALSRATFALSMDFIGMEKKERPLEK